MVILFKPWRKPSELKGKYLSWTHAFNAMEFKPEISQIMANTVAQKTAPMFAHF